MKRLRDWYWVFDQVMPATVQRPLLDLTAARYLIVARAIDKTPAVLGSDGPPPRRDGRRPRVREPAGAAARLLRAARRGGCAGRRLPALSRAGAVNPRATALITAAPRSGFLGTDAAATGDVEFAANEADRVVLRVRAGPRGFLFLADEYFPGWHVRVDGREEEILRANHTFRLVEVPRGESEVVFLYRPDQPGYRRRRLASQPGGGDRRLEARRKGARRRDELARDGRRGEPRPRASSSPRVAAAGMRRFATTSARIRSCAAGAAA